MLNKKNIEDILALTPLQEGMLFHYLKEPESALYFEQLSLEVTGDIRPDLFEKTWNYLVESNEMLRTLFRWEKVENPVQIILKEHKLKTEYFEFTGVDSEEKRAELKQEDRKKKFNLQEVPFRVTLCKISEKKYEILISNHHILYDGWSNGIIIKEFFQTYYRLATGQEIGKPAKTKFKEFIKWLHGREKASQEEFWKTYFTGFDVSPVLSVKSGKKAEPKNPLKYSLPPVTGITYNRLKNFTGENKISLATLLYSAWGIVLQRYNNSEDVVFGTTISGRSTKVKGIEEIVGLFINTLPLRVKNHRHDKIRDLLYRVYTAIQSREEHGSTPLVDINEYAGLRSGDELFDTIAVIENYPLDERLRETGGQLSPCGHTMYETPHYDLTVAISTFGEIRVDFIYNPEVLEKAVIRRLSRHFLTVVEAIPQALDRETRLLEILSPEEKQRLTVEFNGRASGFTADKTIQRLFCEQAKRTPANIALVGRMHGALNEADIFLTYRELNEITDALAHYLKMQGAGENRMVGLLVDKSVEMIIGQLGILKAGCAYVPLNPGAPMERNRYMLEECGATILLTIAGISQWAEKISPSGKVIYLDKTDYYDHASDGQQPPPRTRQTASGTAYVIFTS
ncbi:MAG: AMP-binding protein, partial [bacterium]|nr:AMP-binding protein [bacterium]